MKRICASIVDIFIMQIIVSAVGNAFFMLVIRPNQERVTIGGLMAVSFIVSVVVMWLYFFISDYCCSGGGIGKRVIGIKLVSKGKRLPLSVSLKHSTVKLIACCVYPITAIYYLCKRRLPYDRWLGLEIIDR